MTDSTLSAHFHAAMSEIDPHAWDAMVNPDYPHLTHMFLKLAESSGSVCEDTGWLPCHITLQRDEQIVAAMPLYQKGHSWGEFIFDWSWADAYQRNGLPYYPKLVSASPFTPATTDKLLVNPAEDAVAMRKTLLASAIEFADRHDFSSLHLHFVSAAEHALIADDDNRLLIRTDCQFHWHNQDYASFDDFLGQFSSKKRKNVKRERRRIREAGLTHRIVDGHEVTPEEVDAAFQLCSHTFAVRGHSPYLNREFFAKLCQTMPSSIVFVLAEYEEQPVAAAILFRGANTLYGRYWGSTGDFHSLHFETCYYQGIEYCIQQGIQRYEPGTQGEHKVARGFLPATTYSAHWLARPDFSAAIADYLGREQRGVDAYIAEIDRRSPFKATYKPKK